MKDVTLSKVHLCSTFSVMTVCPWEDLIQLEIDDVMVPVYILPHHVLIFI